MDSIAIPLITKRIAILGYDAGVQEGNIRKTMAARGLVKRGPLRRSGRDLVFRCYPTELLSPPKKQKLTFWVNLLLLLYSMNLSECQLPAGYYH